MSSSSPLPLALPEQTTPRPRAPRKARAAAGERRRNVTSFQMKHDDELILDALRSHFGEAPIGPTVLRALRIAAEAEGIDVRTLLETRPAAA